MKKNYLLLMIGLFFILPFMSQAESRTETLYYNINIPGLNVPPLIFTEFRVDNIPNYYFELTNVGEVPIDLNDFAVISGHTYTKMEESTDLVARLGHLWHYTPLGDGVLAPGESYVGVSVYDVDNETGMPFHNVGILEKATQLFHQPEPSAELFLNRPDWEAFDKDSVSRYYPMDIRGGTGCFYLEYKFIDSETGLPDSTLVDNANFSIDDVTGFQNGQWGKGDHNFPIAGISDPIDDHIIVRKAKIKQGNMDWHLSRGTDMETSEWLPIPKYNSKFDVFTTIGTHGDFSLDYKLAENAVAVYDEGSATLTIPWHLPRGEAINQQFDFGPGQSWLYTENASDSLYTNVRNGDVFSIFAVGDVIERKDMTINVTSPGANVAIAYPNRQYVPSLNVTGEVESWSWTGRYGITQGLDLDSIYNIGHGTPVDTLLKYIYKPEKATWEIKYSGDETRANLKKGDMLIVTSEDGSVVKEYSIEVRDYIPSSNSTLSAITWPDFDPIVYWDWEHGDTIPEFSPNKGSYKIMLVDGTSAIPALHFKTTDINADMEVVRATNINGTIGQRTTTVTVTAEDGSTSTYSILFEIETVPVQPNKAEPFISELMLGHNFAYAIEIYNPGNQELDLDRYMIAGGREDDNLSDLVGRLNLNQIYNHQYVPGYRFKNDLDPVAYAAEPGFLVPDNVTNAIVTPGDVFVAGSMPDGAWEGGRFWPARKLEGFSDGAALDFVWYGWDFQHPDSKPEDAINDPYNRNPHGVQLGGRYRFPIAVGWVQGGVEVVNSVFLLKILNDSILNGTKDITDPYDYEIVDRIQKSTETDDFYIAGRDINGSSPHWQGWSLTRKPHVWRGVKERGEGLGDNGGLSEENSEWIIFNSRENKDYAGMWQNIGSHSMNPITVYLSTVTSTRLKVTPGYEGALTITGDLSGLTVATFMAIIDRADPGQTLEVFDGENLLASDAPIGDGMMLKVTSFDEQNITNYTLVNAPLSGNNILVAKDGSGLEVGLAGPVGTVEGVVLGTTVIELLGDLTVPDKAVLNVIDVNNNLVPLTFTDFDSVKVDVMAGPNIHLEVVAENGAKVVYELVYGTNASDAVLYSSILHVDQENLVVNSVPFNITLSSLLEMVYANKGATISVVDKLGFPYVNGRLNFDDKVIVTSEDESKSVSYRLKFVGFDLVSTSIRDVKHDPRSANDYNVYPNPTSSELTIHGTDVESVQIYNLFGQLQRVQMNGANKINVSSLAQGIYILRIIDQNGNASVLKFSKK